MNLDLTWFSYGAGLVMFGWICGQVVGSFFTALGRIRG